MAGMLAPHNLVRQTFDFMNTQQRRLFFQARKSGGLSCINCINLSREGRFASCEVILAIFAALLFFLFGCASLTQDRVAVLSAIAGQAAQVGAQDWLARHPDQKPIFDSIIIGIAALVKGGVTNQMAYVELLNALPTATLAGTAGELYITEERLVIWDAELKKAVAVGGAAERPVLRATISGLRRALAPLPPAPVPVPLTGTDGIKGERVR